MSSSTSVNTLWSVGRDGYLELLPVSRLETSNQRHPETKGCKGRDKKTNGGHRRTGFTLGFTPLWPSLATLVGDLEPAEVCAIRNGQFVNIYARTLLEQKCDKGILSLSTYMHL